MCLIGLLLDDAGFEDIEQRSFEDEDLHCTAKGISKNIKVFAFL